MPIILFKYEWIWKYLEMFKKNIWNLANLDINDDYCYCYN